jgi:hypothetical protein
VTTTAADTTVEKVSAPASPSGEMGQVYLVSGKRVSMRLWRDEPPQEGTSAQRRASTRRWAT